MADLGKESFFSALQPLREVGRMGSTLIIQDHRDFIGSYFGDTVLLPLVKERMEMRE